MMRIPVVLKDGSEQKVNNSKMQSLMTAHEVMFFKRKTGWVVVGRDNVRGVGGVYLGEDRRDGSTLSSESPLVKR